MRYKLYSAFRWVDDFPTLGQLQELEHARLFDRLRPHKLPWILLLSLQLDYWQDWSYNWCWKGASHGYHVRLECFHQLIDHLHTDADLPEPQLPDLNQDNHRVHFGHFSHNGTDRDTTCHPAQILRSHLSNWSRSFHQSWEQFDKIPVLNPLEFCEQVNWRSEQSCVLVGLFWLTFLPFTAVDRCNDLWIEKFRHGPTTQQGQGSHCILRPY